MKRFLLLLAAVGILATAVWAASPKDYQVTGPIVSADNDKIVVKKGNDNWEIARDKGTKVTGDLKPGSKVTIHYIMTATTVEVKEGGAKTKGKTK